MKPPEHAGSLPSGGVRRLWHVHIHQTDDGVLCCLPCMPLPPSRSTELSGVPAHLVKGDSVLAAFERVSFCCRSAFQPLEKQAPPQYPFPLVTQHIVTVVPHWQHSCPLCSLGGRGIVSHWGRDLVSSTSKAGAERAFTRCNPTGKSAGHSSLQKNIALDAHN